MGRFINLLAILLVSMLIFTNSAFSDQVLLEENNIPSIKGTFPSDPEKFTFAIIGDKTGGGEQNWPIFDRAMDEINELNPDFAITIGDHIQGYVSDMNAVKGMWDEYMDHISKLDVPVFLLPGNHDITNTAMYNYWKENLGKTYYSFDYKGCHFLVLNTEEHQAPEKAEVAEKAMLDFALSDIQKNRDARHIFVFMHKPLWVDAKESWGPIEEALKGVKSTVFGGHWHQLMYEQRNDTTYIVIGATGAGINEIAVPELGMFHHFTLVSVEDGIPNIAIVEPGNIFPEDISIRETHQRLRDSWVKFRSEMPIPENGKTVSGKLIATVNNKADKPILVRISITGVDDSLWKIRPREAIIESSPREEEQSVFELIYSADSISAQPKYVVESYYAGNLLGKEESFISFADTSSMRKIGEWMTGETINLPEAKDRETPVNFFAGYKTDETLSWQVASANEKGVIDLDRIYDKPDNVMAFTKAFIYSPKDETIWGAIVADDLALVSVNGKEITPLYNLDKWHGGAMFFPVSLKAGWNQTIVKSADFTGGWNFTFMLDDPDSQLKFSSKMPTGSDE